MGDAIKKSYYKKKIEIDKFLSLYGIEIDEYMTEQQLSLINDFLEEKNISAQEMTDIIRYHRAEMFSWMERWGGHCVYIWVVIFITAGLCRLFGIIISTDWILLLSVINLAIFFVLKVWGHKQYKYYRHIDDRLLELGIRPYLKKDPVT